MTQRGEPVKACALGVFACCKEQVCRQVVVDILAVDGVLDVNGTMTFGQHRGVGSQEGTTDFDDMISPGNENGREGGE